MPVEGKIKRSELLTLHTSVKIKKKRCTGSSNNKKVAIRLRRPVVSVSWILQKLFESSLQIFKGPGTVPCPEDVQNLCTILDGMNSEDVGLNRNMSFFQPKTGVEGTAPRLTSATVYKCENFEICIFFLPPKAVIPLHNHPEMTVFSKLLLGTMHIKAYDWADHQPHKSNLPSKFRLAKLKANKVFGSPCDASVLYPTSGGNIHEFEAISACAFLDVLGPPYSNSDGRDCCYYREVGRGFAAGDSSYRFLEETEIPNELEIHGIEYMGPKIVDSAE